MTTSARDRVFISYSHADRDWCDRLLVHLRPYIREGLSIWDDKQIESGSVWSDEIQKALASARVAVLLVSADFIASSFIMDVELPALMRAANKGEITLMSLFVGYGAHEKTGLQRFQALNDPKSPLNDYREKRDADLTLREAAVRIGGAFKNPPAKGATSITHRTRIPGRFVAATLGWLDFHRAAAFRTSIREAIRKTGVARSVVDEVLHLRERERSRDTRLEDASIWIVHGPAGVGKSTLVSDLIRQTADSFDLWLILRGGRITGDRQDEADERMADEILGFVDDLLPVTRERRLSAAGVAYALNSRRVLIVVEDAHQGGSARDVLKKITRYLDVHHRSNEGVRIVTTTRESRQDLAGLATASVRVQPIEPLPRREAQNLFYSLCIDNGVPADELVRHGDKLGAAFATDGIRTPLFVSICALLACRPRNDIDIDRILEMSASEVLDTFIDNLLERSGAPETELAALRDTYRRLAMTMWPEWENCRVEAVLNALRDIAPGQNAENLLSFLERGGFLSRPWYQPTRVNFPHHAIADYLASSAMLKSLDFSKLRISGSEGRFEGLMPFFAELFDESAFSQLLAVSFAPALAILRYRTDQGKPLSVKPIFAAMLSWAVNPRRGDGQSPETWRAARELLKERVSDAWLQQLVTDIEQRANVTAHAIESLASLGHAGANDLLGRWLPVPQNNAIFEAAAGEECTARWLVDTAGSYPSETGRTAFRILLRQSTPAARQVTERIMLGRADDLDENDIRALWAAGPSMLRAVGEALKESPIHIKRRVSQSVASALGRALIPCGVYDVPDDGKMIRVSISRPLLVPLESEILSGSFREVGSYEDALQRRLPKQKLIMTKYQALVALNYFGHPAPGIRFSAAREDLPEIFWEPPGKNPRLYVLPDTSTTTVAAYKPPVEMPVLRRVAYRPIDQL